MKMTRRDSLHALAISSLAMLAFNAGCASTPKEEPNVPSGSGDSAPATAAAAPTGQQTLRLHGSNTIGLTLAPALAKGFLTKLGAPKVVVNADNRKSQQIWIQGVVNGNQVNVEVFAPGTKVGFEDLASDDCDVAMASRTINQAEADRLKALGDMNSPTSDHVLGIDGIAVIVNKANRVGKLTTKQLHNIFMGEYTNWSQLSGASGPIHLYVRDTKSGTFDAFKAMVLNGKDPKGDAKAFDDSEALSAEVAKDEGGIGFVGLPYVRDAKAVAVQDGDARALMPTSLTIATEDYALSRRLHLYSAENPKSPLVKPFIEYALSDEGQQLVAKEGFVALTMKTEAQAPPPDAPSGYAADVSGAVRLNVDFRFRTGSANLDTKALPDLDRVVRWMKSPENSSKKILLNGFADSQGNDRVNVDLSKTRAETVARELRQRGVHAEKVTGFGSALPIAPNDTPDGRERNRRVEVWVH